MNLLSKLRGIAFWTLDNIKGGQVRNAYEDLEKYDHMDSLSTELMEYQNKALDDLLSHASTTTEFYKKYYSKDLSISDFPLIDKNIIRENQDDFLSNKYTKDQLVTTSTSGSTGTPFVCYQNREKKKRVNGEIIYYSGKVGYAVGSNLIFLRSLTDRTRKSPLHQWIQNENLIDVSSLDHKGIKKIISEMEEASKHGSMVLSYSGTYDVLRDYFIKNPIDHNCNIHGMVGGAEMLFDDTREMMEKVFNCKCVSRYSNQENGVLGQDDIKNNNFILNEAHYYIEIFDLEKDEPAKEGEVGRIVVTDLYNYAMPMIRYDTGDIGSFVYLERNGVRKKAIGNFGGRKLDMVYDCNGNPLSPHKVSVSFWSFPEFKQYQFIQEGQKEYRVKLNVEGEFTKQDELRKMLMDLVGSQAEISIEMVDEIPTLSSGKRKYIMNNYK